MTRRLFCAASVLPPALEQHHAPMTAASFASCSSPRSQHHHYKRPKATWMWFRVHAIFLHIRSCWAEILMWSARTSVFTHALTCTAKPCNVESSRERSSRHVPAFTYCARVEFTHAKLEHDFYSLMILHARVLSSSVSSPKEKIFRVHCQELFISCTCDSLTEVLVMSYCVEAVFSNPFTGGIWPIYFSS